MHSIEEMRLVGRRPDPERRQELLGAAVEHLLVNGLHHVSLRTVAKDVGTSARMLVYHFGSKDELMAKALEEARRQQRVLFMLWIAPVAGELYSVTLRKAWAFFESEQAMRYHRLFQQLAAASREPGSPYEGFAARAVLDWLPVVQSGFAASGMESRAAAALATMTLATVRGLIMDLMATGDAARTRKGCEALVALLDARLAGPRHRGARAATQKSA
jgi:AcrR family transcriptional regulator